VTGDTCPLVTLQLYCGHSQEGEEEGDKRGARRWTEREFVDSRQALKDRERWKE